MNDVELNGRLASADPALPLNGDAREALNDLRTLISADELGPRRTQEVSRRSRRTLIAIGVVAALAAAGTAAAATGLAARTGLFGQGGEEGTGELVRLDAPDFPAVAADIGKDIPLPPGGNFDRYLARKPDGPTMQTESGIESTMSFIAACQWSTYWLARHAVGDADAMRTAQSILNEVPHWPALVASDGDGGTTAMWTRIAEAAAAGDPTSLRDAGYTVNCVIYG